MRNIENVIVKGTYTYMRVKEKGNLPKRLYHYTGSSNLYNIVGGKCFYLTDIRYLNDESEYVHIFDYALSYAKKKLDYCNLVALMTGEALTEEMLEACRYSDLDLDRVRSIMAGSFDGEMTKQESDLKRKLRGYVKERDKATRGETFYSFIAWAIKAFDIHRTRTNPNCYVTSFSEKRDQLSQWRGYCPTGGYSLGFDMSEFSEAVSPTFVLVKCLYKDDDKEKVLNSIFSCFWVKIKELIELGLSEREISSFTLKPKSDKLSKKKEGFINHVGSTLGKFAPLFKHKGFEEEAEWRFVNASALFPEDFAVPYKKFRPGPTRLIPYVEMQFGSPKTVEVTVGPMDSQELAKDSVGGFLEQRSSDGTINDIGISSIPYRTSHQ